MSEGRGLVNDSLWLLLSWAVVPSLHTDVWWYTSAALLFSGYKALDIELVYRPSRHMFCNVRSLPNLGWTLSGLGMQIFFLGFIVFAWVEIFSKADSLPGSFPYDLWAYFLRFWLHFLSSASLMLCIANSYRFFSCIWLKDFFFHLVLLIQRRALPSIPPIPLLFKSKTGISSRLL